MFRYKLKANYQPNRGHYLQILSGKDLYKQTVVVSARTHDTFPARFWNIFVDYPLGQMHVEDKLWTNWNKAPVHLWQTQLNFAVWCASSAFGVSLAHLNYTKHPMIRSVYCFHIYYHVRRILKKLQTPLPHQTGLMRLITLIQSQNFQKFVRIMESLMIIRGIRMKNFIGLISAVFIGPDSMTWWIIEELVGFTDVGLLRISESVRAYAYLILSSQASARSSIVRNMASSLTAQSAFLNNFEKRCEPQSGHQGRFKALSRHS